MNEKISKRPLYDLIDQVSRVRKYYQEIDEHIADYLHDCLCDINGAEIRIDELNEQHEND